MRSPSALVSLMGAIADLPFLQAVAERDAFVEHKALAAPSALFLRHAFEIAQDAALEVVDLGKAMRQQIGAGLFAANAAGAEHRDLLGLGGIEMPGGKILELSNAPDAGIDRAFDRPHRDLEGVAGVDHQRIRA